MAVIIGLNGFICHKKQKKQKNQCGLTDSISWDKPYGISFIEIGVLFFQESDKKIWGKCPISECQNSWTDFDTHCGRVGNDPGKNSLKFGSKPGIFLMI